MTDYRLGKKGQTFDKTPRLYRVLAGSLVNESGSAFNMAAVSDSGARQSKKRRWLLFCVGAIMDRASSKYPENLAMKRDQNLS